ncbi:MAG: Asp-tRNA(Asn)/Glu-tRNA(Gln) amidotransferase GatCAB subunit A [Acidobacteria bacterium]|nr:MAG: Asp-tRNA(Asn)/Glu-tRNA(Gln) amidotransferase GatCAB subunit A [Acidobacteriota bacterium]
MSASTAAAIARSIREGQTTATEVVEAHLAEIERTDGDVRAFLEVLGGTALEQAKAVDAGEVTGPLAGVPIAIKDVLCMEGIATTCGSKILEGWRPPYTATAVRRLVEAGAIPIGKTNMDEFAMGSSTENSAFGPTLNPWSTGHVPGGSSGGSAAAVAAGHAPVSLGSDTGGSIRQPASLCGVVGMKPTYGRVSRYGLVAFASSLDQIGPFSHTVEDAAIVYAAMAGHDPMDSTSLPESVGDPVGAIGRGIEGIRFGVVTELAGDAIEPEVAAAFASAIEGLGAGEVSLPSFDHALSAYYLIAPAEASSNLARFDGVRYGLRIDAADTTAMMRRTREAGFGPEVKRRIMLGTYALSAGYYDAYYGQAQRVRTLVANDFGRAFEDFDILLSPTSPTTAFEIGERTADPLAMYLSDLCTIPANLAGIPAISIPAGVDSRGLPIGLQLMAPALEEERLFAAAAELETRIGFDAKPALTGGAE